MSKLSKYSVKSGDVVKKHSGEAVTNFMAGTSYNLSPLQTLKIVAASSIFAEPQYYRDGIKEPKSIKNKSTLNEYSIFADVFKDEKTAADVFTSAIDAALDYDFKGTLDLAKELRSTFYMRLNPSVIFIRASIHSKRVEFNEKNPGYMKSIGKSIAFIPNDLTNQMDYFMFLNKGKNKLSSLVKRTWAERLEEYSRYHLNKYKGKSLIDLVRISHAWNKDIDELMKTGTLKVEETEKTWEILRSDKKTWVEILNTISVPHMALLRNLRGIFSEIKDLKIAKDVIEKLKGGVIDGKQFPFRYWSAYKAIEKEADVNHKRMLLDGLEECMDISVANMPKLSGKTISLSDNSGSAWGAVTSEYGTTVVAEIANLSSLITGKQSDEGEIGLFGDRLVVESVSKRNGLLSQLEEVNKIEKKHGKLGQSTENGIWIFFKDAIAKKKHYDNIFIYSDMQAGHGGLYGIDPNDYKEFVHGGRYGRHHIDVLALVDKYRKTVNAKVNIFPVQVAGYDNSILPENLYRGAVLTGWTGKELQYASALIKIWDEVEK